MRLQKPQSEQRQKWLQKNGLDIHNYDEIIKFAKKEACDFKLPKNFAGGRFQTRHSFIFIHIRSNGELGRIEISKPGGSKFYLNP